MNPCHGAGSRWIPLVAPDHSPPLCSRLFSRERAFEGGGAVAESGSGYGGEWGTLTSLEALRTAAIRAVVTLPLFTSPRARRSSPTMALASTRPRQAPISPLLVFRFSAACCGASLRFASRSAPFQLTLRKCWLRCHVQTLVNLDLFVLFNERIPVLQGLAECELCI